MNTMIAEEQVWLLDANDRCDRCQAQAYIKVIGEIGDLLFCGHHYNNVMNDSVGYKKMMDFMVEVIDERDRLIENKAKEEPHA